MQALRLGLLLALLPVVEPRAAWPSVSCSQVRAGSAGPPVASWARLGRGTGHRAHWAGSRWACPPPAGRASAQLFAQLSQQTCRLAVLAPLHNPQ